ncbi:MAG: PEP-CTERM sorting domain-containing protein [Phycisphaeraceae bacterium]|nr:PEP-CTERM sorting domain-containing protein [Phycisphaeraceae bacterium]
MIRKGSVVLVWRAVALLVLLAVAGSAWALPYSADEIVPLPAPNPNYTNAASGTVILGAYPDEYIIMVENELRFDHWKEWMIIYTITPLEPNDWLADLHVDYSMLINPGGGPPLFENLQMGLDTAFWQTYYGGTGSLMPLTWTVVGFPNTVVPLKVNPLQADLVVCTDPFNWNPEWVSLEFGGANVRIDYQFVDWCIPEPGSLALLAVAGLGWMVRRR